MKKRLIIALPLALSVAGTIALAEDTRTERVEFRKGATSAHLEGTIVGYETVDYMLRAAAGQTMKVEVTTNNRFLYFNVIDTTTDEALFVGSSEAEPNTWSGELASDGDYTIRVYLMRNEARRDGKAHYSVDISIS
jgi:hypothetical protein